MNKKERRAWYANVLPSTTREVPWAELNKADYYLVCVPALEDMGFTRSVKFRQDDMSFWLWEGADGEEVFAGFYSGPASKWSPTEDFVLAKAEISAETSESLLTMLSEDIQKERNERDQPNPLMAKEATEDLDYDLQKQKPKNDTGPISPSLITKREVNFSKEKAPYIGFADAVVLCFKKYQVGDGRATRGECLWFHVIHNALAILSYSSGYPIALITLLPTINVSIRRLHDIGKSGWYLLLLFVPYLGFLVIYTMLCLPSEEGGNKYGPSRRSIYE